MPDAAPENSQSHQPISIESVLEALESGDTERIVSICQEAHPGDIESAFDRLDDQEREAVLGVLPADLISILSDYLTAADMETAVLGLPETEQREVLDSMSDDELVDLLQEVPEEDRPHLLDLLPEDKQAVSEDLLQFPEHTAGGRMTMALAKIRESLTVKEALDQLEEQKEETEILLSRIYVVDDQDRFLGKVRLRDLAFSPWSTPISSIMDGDQIAVEAMADQEEAAQMIGRYDLVALPVVDENFRLLGAITHDDALDILEEETTEDMERASAIGGERGEQAYLQTPVATHFRRRFIWVFMLAFLALASGFVLHAFEDVLKTFFVLTLYLPMVVAAGGNTGSQAATMVIRSMSLGELAPAEFVRVVWKEARVGLAMGAMLGFFIALQIHFFLPAEYFDGAPLLPVAAVVGLALTAQVMFSTLIGAALPLGARAIKLDPAVVASPAITTFVDVTGLIIYFVLARALLGVG